jgi:hypothetical protein
MAEHEEQESLEEQETQKKRAEKILAIQNDIKNSITTCILEIKNLADSLTSLMEKEILTEEDIINAFDKTDGFEEQSQEISALLFSLRDTVR